MTKVYAKPQDLLTMEDAFAQIKAKKNVNGALSTIQRIISRSFDLKVSVHVIDNTGGKFFGMSLYPSKNELQALVDAIMLKQTRGEQLVKMWQETKEWVIEIDSLLIEDISLNANPAEMVAVLLHEIGHTIYSNSIPQRVYRIMRYQLIKASFVTKKLVQWKKVHRLFDIIFIEACDSKNFHFVNLHAERVADDFAVKMGYADSLNNFLNKLLETQGNQLINRTESDLDQDIKAATTWTLDNVGELEFRKDKLRKMLQAEMYGTSSDYARRIILDIKTLFFGSEDKDVMKTLVTEQYLMQEYQQVINEGLASLFDKGRKVRKLTQADIDILTIEAGRVENEDDRIYVLDLIYDKLDIISLGLDLLGSGKKDQVTQSKDTLLGYKDQLDKIRKQILALTIKPKTYSLYVKYPAGYEG